MLPNGITPVLVSATIGIASAILTEAGLSFLGFGVPPPHATWGNILSEGKYYLFDAPWLTLIPGIAILIVVLAFNSKLSPSMSSMVIFTSKLPKSSDLL